MGESNQKWLTLFLLGVVAAMGFGWWWVIDSNTPKATTLTIQPPTPSKEPAVTAEELKTFKDLVALTDPKESAIKNIQEYNETELLYLTVNPAFTRDSKANQANLAKSLRDAWVKTCDCYGQIVLQTSEGVELIHISALGEPKFKQD